MSAPDNLFSEELYLAVPTASLVHRKTSIADLYVRLPSDRMIKIAHKGGEIDLVRLNRFGEKHVQHLYVHRDEFGSVVTDLVKGTELLNKMPNLQTDKKIGRFFHVAETVYSELLKLPISDASLQRAVKMSQEFSFFMNEKPDFAKLIRVTVDVGDDFTRHSLGTVVTANLLTAQLEWSSPKLLSPVTMGAFFHDIGLKELPEEVRFKPRVLMTKEEIGIYESHVPIGVHLLGPLPFITPEVIRIVAEHHEVPNGSGFPNKTRLDRIYPLAKVVSLANMMAHDIFDQHEENKPFSVDYFLDKIEHVYTPMYGADLGRAARKVFKLERPEKVDKPEDKKSSGDAA